MTPNEIADWLDEQTEGDGKNRGEAMEAAADMLRSPLIAAAPDMLEALRQCRRPHYHNDMDSFYTCPCHPTIRNISVSRNNKRMQLFLFVGNFRFIPTKRNILALQPPLAPTSTRGGTDA